MSSSVSPLISLDILHLHIFKCAGTTFSWILQKCFPDGLLYVESADPGSRLDWRKVADLNLEPYRALTSHLIDCPPPRSLARVKVTFVRQPLSRFRSAYGFLRDVQNKIPPDTSFKDYMMSQATSIISNFQARHLSPQGSDGFHGRQGWQLRPDLIELDRPDLFVGVVERFDDSLVVLEQRLASMHCPLDLSYPQPLNARAGSSPVGDGAEPPPAWILNQLETDQALWQRSNAHLDGQIKRLPRFSSLLADFRARCAALAQGPSAADGVRVLPPKDWTYLP